MNRRPLFLYSCLCFGFAFFYVPILSMIVYSFNRSRLATVWGGFSTQWYGKLLANDQILDAAFLSLRIALLSATFATILGTMAGIALARFQRFRGRTLFQGLVTAPLVMPEVITGISTLMLFILMAKWIGWPAQRGFTTITIAHITFSMTYVTTIVQSRLLSMDQSRRAQGRRRCRSWSGARSSSASPPTLTPWPRSSSRSSPLASSPPASSCTAPIAAARATSSAPSPRTAEAGR